MSPVLKAVAPKLMVVRLLQAEKTRAVSAAIRAWRLENMTCQAQSPERATSCFQNDLQASDILHPRLNQESRIVNHQSRSVRTPCVVHHA